FVELLDLVVDFSGADAHATRIERRVRTAIDDDAAMVSDFGEVAVAPGVVEALKVGGVIFGTVRIVPEHHRHAWEGVGADQLALLGRDLVAVVVPDLDRHAEPRTLNFADPYRL